MEDLTKKQVGYLVFSLILLALFFPACGGGDGDNPPPTATITGTVPGTTVVAMDENNKELKGNTATGSPKTFTLSGLPVPGKYRVFFIENENTPQQKVCFLYQDATNIFQINSATNIDLGFVDTSSGKGVPANNPLNVPGVSSGGEDVNILPCIEEPFTGTWKGTISVGTWSDGHTVTLTQIGANVTGTYSNVTNTGSYKGTLSGTISGNTMNWTVTSTAPGCPGTASGTYTMNGYRCGTTMNSTFSGSGCDGPASNGQTSVTRQ